MPPFYWRSDFRFLLHLGQVGALHMR